MSMCGRKGWVGTLNEFINDASQEKIADELKKTLGQEYDSIEAEDKSWRESHKALADVLKLAYSSDKNIPIPDIMVLCEYQLARLPYRCDIVLLGKKGDQDKALVIELKRWSKGNVDPLDQEYYKDYVKVWNENHTKNYNHNHPSIQVTNYKNFLKYFYQNFENGKIQVNSCAFLHNYDCDFSDEKQQDALINGFSDAIEESMLFGGNDNEKKRFREFIISEIDKPSTSVKRLLDNSSITFNDSFFKNLLSISQDKEIFSYFDEQGKEILSSFDKQGNVLNDIVKKLGEDSKNNRIFIVNGGPGTGKTVVAFNLLLRIKKKLHWNNIAYVTRNWDFLNACKTFLEMRRTDTETKNHLKLLNVKEIGDRNQFNCLIVDEAQQLLLADNEEKNDTMRIFSAANNVVFFMDEGQKIAFHDIGSYKEIINDSEKFNKKNKLAKKFQAVTPPYELSAQYRNGSSEYINWVNYFLKIKTDHIERPSMPSDYCFKVIDNPSDLFEMIQKKQKNRKITAQTVAGWCWPWTKNDRADIEIKYGNNRPLHKRWARGTMWSICPRPKREEKVVSIRKVVGQDFDYVGVIIGKDLTYSNEKGVIVNPDKNIMFSVKTFEKYGGKEDFLKGRMLDEKEIKEIKSYSDSNYAKNNPKDKSKVEEMIRNQYRVHLTRGRKGCFVYCDDVALRDYLKSLLLEKCNQ